SSAPFGKRYPDRVARPESSKGVGVRTGSPRPSKTQGVPPQSRRGLRPLNSLAKSNPPTSLRRFSALPFRHTLSTATWKKGTEFASQPFSRELLRARKESCKGYRPRSQKLAAKLPSWPLFSAREHESFFACFRVFRSQVLLSKKGDSDGS